MKKIDCFIPFAGKEQAEKTVQGLQATGLIGNIRLVTTDPMLEPLPGCEILSVDMPYSSTAMKTIAEKTDAEYTLLYTKETTLELGMFALERMMHIAEDSDAGMVYADHYQIADGKQTNAPVIDYQFGSLRDDFNFGSVLLFNTSKLKEAACRMKCDYNFAGLYDLRLKLSQKADLVHINEYLNSEVENDTRIKCSKEYTGSISTVLYHRIPKERLSPFLRGCPLLDAMGRHSGQRIFRKPRKE